MSKFSKTETPTSIDIQIEGCSNCPFCIPYDAQDVGDYYGDYCNLKDEKNYILQRTSENEPQTPDWCPLEGKKCTVKF